MSNEVVGYIHRLSPVKKVKSTEYCEFELQLKDEAMNGVCFSHAKRKLLQDAADSMTPLKISHFVRGSFCGQPSVKINNMTRLSDATTAECDYQYKASPTEQKISLKMVVCSIKPNQIVGQVEGKISACGEVEIKGSSKLKMKNSVINDGTALVKLSLWEEDIEKVVSGRVYRVGNVRLRLFNGEKALTTTRGSTFEEIDDETMSNLDEIEAQIVLDELKDLRTMVVERVEEIEDIDRFKKCRHCQKKLQASVSGKIIRCDSCGRRMRVADCAKSISVRLVVLEQETEVSLTVFRENLEQLIEGALDFNDDELSEKILDLTQLRVKYNSKNIIEDLAIQE